MTRSRVLVLTKTTALGGAERLVMNTLAHLDRERFDYRIGAFDDGGPLARACTEAGLPFGVLPRSPRGLRRSLARDRVDLVHAHLPLPGTLARVATRGTPTRVVYTEHTLQDVYRAPSRWLNVASYGWQDAVVAVSQRVRASALAHVGSTPLMSVIPNGVDLDQLRSESARPPEPQPPRAPAGVALLVPASLTPVKGHTVLFDALARISKLPGCPVDVWLAGCGPEQARLERIAARIESPIRVHVLGWRADVFALQRAADAVVLPSLGEGHPLVLLEAAALGRAVIATRVGGIPEIVEHERTGLLVPPGDHEALADALQRLRVDPELRAGLGAAGRRVAEARFDVRHTVAAVESLYERVLTGRGPLRGRGVSAPGSRTRSRRLPRDLAPSWRGR